MLRSQLGHHAEDSILEKSSEETDSLRNLTHGAVLYWQTDGAINKTLPTHDLQSNQHSRELFFEL